MKRLLPILLAVLVSLAGCGAIGQTSQQLTPASSTTQTQTPTANATETPTKTTATTTSTTVTETPPTVQPTETTQTPSEPTATQTPTTPTATTATPTPVTTTATPTPTDTQPAPASGGATGGSSGTPVPTPEQTTESTATPTQDTVQEQTPEPEPEPEPLGRFEGPSYTAAEINAGPQASLSASQLVSAHESGLADVESVTSFGRYWSENDVEDRIFHAEETIEIDESRDVSHLHWADRVRSAGSTTRHFDRRVTTDSWTAYNATTVFPEKPTNYLTGKVCEPYEDDSLRVPVDVAAVADVNRLTYLVTELDFRQVENIRYDGVNATVYATTDPKNTLSTDAATTLKSYRAILIVSDAGLVHYSHTSVTLIRDGETVSFGETRTLRDIGNTTLSPSAWTDEVEPGENC